MVKLYLFLYFCALEYLQSTIFLVCSKRHIVSVMFASDNVNICRPLNATIRLPSNKLNSRHRAIYRHISNGLTGFIVCNNLCAAEVVSSIETHYEREVTQVWYPGAA